MTISSAHKEIKEIIREYHVYGAEAVINALLYACDGNPYLTREDLLKLIDNGYKMLEYFKSNKEGLKCQTQRS